MLGRHVTKEDSMAKAMVRRKPADGEQLVVEYEASGLGRKDFCAARSISVNTLDYWRRRTRRPVAAGFVELMPVAGSVLDIELDLGGGAVLRISRRA